ncbi:MAG: hypothetical protein NDI60_03480 [Elusimicrobiales bacterium]|nr:hypothetical protein [Elusimicrobiales bacterium]
MTPKVMLISTSQSNTEALISGFRQSRPDISEAEIVVRMVGGDFPKKVLEALEWAQANDVRIIEIDGNATRSANPKVMEKIKELNKAGFSLAAVEFA